MGETKKISPLKNVELHKDCYVFFVDFNEKVAVNHNNIFEAFRDSYSVIYIDKYTAPIEVPLDTILSVPNPTKYQFIMKHHFEQILLWQKRITGIVKNDVMNIYYAREGVLDEMGIGGCSVNEINKVTRYCMRRIYDYVLSHFND